MGEAGEYEPVDPFGAGGDGEGDPEAGASPRVSPQPVEKTVDELEGILAAERDEPLILDEEEPPDETEPLLASVNPAVGPEARSQRTARYAAMREAAMAELQRMIDAAPADSPLKQFLYSEEVRESRMEPLRVAFVKTMGKKGQPGKEE